MNNKKVPFGTTILLAAGALLIASGAAPYASATAIQINFGGTVGWGDAVLTLATDPNSSSNYQPTYETSSIPLPLSSYDPAGAQYITGASGSFNGVAITGVLATSPGVAPPGEILPASFSWIDTPPPGPNSYDNLFYADGSPLVCPPTSAGGGVGYPFSGGFLDIYGVAFTLGNGDVVSLWSDGVTAPGVYGPTWPGGLTYGLDVFTPVVGGGYLLSSDNSFDGVSASVPEPSSLWLFGAGALGLFAWRGLVEARKRSSLIG